MSVKFVLVTWLVTACASPVRSSAQTSADQSGVTNSTRLAFELRRGHIMVPARVNGLESRLFMLDTGYGVTMLGPALAESLGLKRTGQMDIVGIAGEEQASVYEGPTFDFSGAVWKPRRVAAFPDEHQGRSRRRDGILGSGFFRRYVIAIDPSEQKLTLHEPAAFHYVGSGELIPLTFRSSTPIVEATVIVSNGSPVQAHFEIDTGCNGGLCLGRHFVEAHRLAVTSGASNGQRFGVGGGTRTQTGHLSELRLGGMVVKRPAADFFLDGSPADPPLAGHIGWELLQDFRVIFDYSRKQMILERR